MERRAEAKSPVAGDVSPDHVGTGGPISNRNRGTNGLAFCRYLPYLPLIPTL